MAAEPLPTLPVMLAKRLCGKVRGTVNLDLRKIDDVRRMLHHVHFDNQKIVIVGKHFRDPESVYFFSYAPLR